MASMEYARIFLRSNIFSSLPNMSLMKVENAPKQGTQVSARIAAIGDLDRLLHCAEALGLLAADPDQWLKGEGSASAAGGPSAEEIEALIAERIDAKKDKNFARADEIRDGLKAQGVVLEDKPGGVTEWRRG